MTKEGTQSVDDDNLYSEYGMDLMFARFLIKSLLYNGSKGQKRLAHPCTLHPQLEFTGCCRARAHKVANLVGDEA